MHHVREYAFERIVERFDPIEADRIGGLRQNKSEILAKMGEMERRMEEDVDANKEEAKRGLDKAQEEIDRMQENYRDTLRELEDRDESP